MSGLIKLVGIGIVGGTLALTIRRERQEMAMMIALATSAVIIAAVIADMGGIIDRVRAIADECGVDAKYFAICVKAVGIAYIAQFAAEILRDCGEGAIASKIEAAGKISILALAMPVIGALIDMCLKVVNAV